MDVENRSPSTTSAEISVKLIFSSTPQHLRSVGSSLASKCLTTRSSATGPRRGTGASCELVAATVRQSRPTNCGVSGTVRYTSANPLGGEPGQWVHDYCLPRALPRGLIAVEHWRA